MLTWRVGRGICNELTSFHISQSSHFSCVPEEGAKDSGLVVNDTPAAGSSNMDQGEVEESVEMKEDEGVAADDLKEEENKKKGPSNMVTGWGKGVKKVVYIGFYVPLLRASVTCINDTRQFHDIRLRY